MFKCMFTLCVLHYATRLSNYKLVCAKEGIFSFRLLFFPLVLNDRWRG